MAQFNLADYETVDARIKRFYTDWPSARILTELVDANGVAGATRWIVKASIWRERTDGEPDATGYAFEVDGNGMANKFSALENCETSARGRALAGLGYSGDKAPSREEMEKVQRASAERKPVTAPADLDQLLADVVDADGIQSLYARAQQEGWWSDAVKVKFSTRKASL